MGVCTSTKKKDNFLKGQIEEILDQQNDNPNGNHADLIDQLTDSKIRQQLQAKPINEILNNLQQNSNKEQIDLTMQLSLKLHQVEESIISLKIPSSIYQNYQDHLYPSLVEISQEDIAKIKSQNIPLTALLLTTETFHILQSYADQENTKWFTEDTIVKKMEKRYNDLAGQIKIEMISTFKKIIKQKTSNNPAMQMRFNTKHAIGMAKQKTLKEQDQQKNYAEVDEFLEELYESAILRLIEQPDYDELFSLLHSTRVKDNIEKLQVINAKFKT